MGEAFAYDPLINWRLGIETTEYMDEKKQQQQQQQSDVSKTFISQLNAGSNSDLNEKAVDVLKRVSQKLKGTDFYHLDKREYTVNEQVHKLILQATSHENLAQAYLGWCPLWQIIEFNH